MKKTVCVLIRPAATLGLFLLFILNAMTAQNPGKKLPYCDQVKDLVKKEMQDQANMDCQTVYRCVDCIERAAGTQKCLPVVMHPGAGCGAILQPVDDMAGAPQKNEMPSTDEQQFRFEIFQSQCLNGNINLHAMVWSGSPEKMQAADQYKYAWDVDGKAAGNTSRLDCVSGKTVRLTVTQAASGHSKTTAVKIIQAPVKDRTTPKDLVAAFKRTGCFGNCPIYTVEFLTDGTVRWNGLANVTPAGKKTAQAPANALAQITEKAKVVKFFNMDNHYPKEQVLDAASTVIYINLDGKEKQVENIAGAPDGFKEFEKLFDDLIQSLGWAKVKSNKPTTDKPTKLNQRN